MLEDLIIECSLNEQVTKAENPHVPIRVDEVVAAGLAAAAAGAAILHFHARDEATGALLHPGTEVYRRIFRGIRRENPDVILLGEMRDIDAIRAALQLAETGHLLMSTLHTNDAAQGIDRIVGAFPADSQAVVRMQLSMSLLGIVNQRLLPSLGGGRVLAAEMLLNTFAVGNLIREGRTDQLHNAMELDSESGMLTLSRSLDALVARGVLAAAEADRARPRLFQGRRTPGHP